MESSGRKTIFYAPSLIPDIAVLEPDLTLGMPPEISAATGIDAFVHCLEAYFAPGFDPMADGIALKGMELIIANLPIIYQNGKDVEARGRMQIAATMGATAFQKGLGMIHSLAHPLSAKYGLHHGLANALLLSKSLRYLELSNLNIQQKSKIADVHCLFENSVFAKNSLWETLGEFVCSLGIKTGLNNRGVEESEIEYLSGEAFNDPCHQSNMIPVTQENLQKVYKESW